MTTPTQKQAGERTQHTPGPWEPTEPNMIAVVSETKQIRICTLNQELHRSEREANARLIAAAPEYYTTATEVWKAWHAVPFDQARMVKAVSALGHVNAQVEGK